MHSKRTILFPFIPQSNRRETWWMLCIAEQNQRGGGGYLKHQGLCFCVWKGDKLQKKGKTGQKTRGVINVIPPTHTHTSFYSHQHFNMQRQPLPRDYITHFYPKEAPESVCLGVNINENVDKLI